MKFCADYLAEPLTMLFNKSLASGVFPEVFKVGHVVPIHKKGAVDDIKNYRPITILSTLAKTFEKIVLNKITFKMNSLISARQHGFMTGRSTSTNLALFQTHIIEAFEQKQQVDVIEMDFSKAFDRVSHSILIKKLEAYGFYGPFLKWLESYLLNRKLLVRYHTSVSKEIHSSSGVPQGSHLGPMLFILYINDISKSLKCNHLLFADDMKLYQNISAIQDAHTLQRDSNLVASWCKNNKMTLNLDKCAVMTYHRIN